MESIVIAAIVAAVASLAGGIASNISTVKTNKDQLEYNKEINQFNNEQQWKMWEATNNYNSYSQQVIRAREAGFNPHIVFNNGNTTSPVNVGNASQLSSLHPRNYDFILQSLLPIISSFDTASQIKNRDKDTEMKDKEIKLFDDTYDNKVKLSSSELDKLNHEVTVIGYAIDDRDFDKALKESTALAAKYGAETAKDNYEYDHQLREMGLPPDLQPKEQMIFLALGALYKKVTGEVLRFSDILNKFGDFMNMGNWLKDQ